MKEAQGELNLAVIVVVIVALLSIFFFSFIWPSIQNNFAKNTRCDEAICPCPERDNNGNCVVPEGGQVTCTYRDDNGTEHDITCAWKG